MYETIRYEIEQGVLTITLNRPERLNAFNSQMRDELLDALDKADADDDVRAIVFTGEGRGFCAGADLGGGGATFSDKRDKSGDQFPDRDGGGTLTLRLFNCLKPLIAAINGPAVGIGITMTLPMDFRLATKGSKMGFVFTRRAIAMEAASSWFLPRLVGPGQAMEWVLTGRVFEAEEGLAGGLLRSVHEPEDLLPAAYEIAQEIVQNTAPVSVALCRQMMWKMLTESHPMAAHRIDTSAIKHCGTLPDAKEGVESFLEKRPAQFTGRPSTDMPQFYPWWTEPEFGPPEQD
ncbi:MAG: enoyl-CoA hydratase/carnithine racemase [Gammaproteobacteria bacterium]|jgi:enoyl-CoA hydratase/carnithine racemase